MLLEVRREIDRAAKARDGGDIDKAFSILGGIVTSLLDEVSRLAHVLADVTELSFNSLPDEMKKPRLGGMPLKDDDDADTP
jgi:hypothetical protein